MDSPVYFPIPFQLKEGMDIYIRSGFKEKIKLGPIRAFDTHKKIFHFYGKYIKNSLITYTHYKPFFLQGKLPFILKTGKSSLKLFIENYKLGVLHYQLLENSAVFRFIPTIGYNKSFLMMGPSHYIRERYLPEEFPLYIQYNLKNGKAARSLIPNWRCKKEQQSVYLKLPNFKPLIRAGGKSMASTL